MLDYFGTDIDKFFNKAEGKLTDFGGELLALYDRKGLEALEDSCLASEVIVLSEIVEAATYDAAEAEELISYALSHYNLASIPLSPFLSVTNIITGESGGGLLPHTHPTSQVTGLVQFVTNLFNSLSTGSEVWLGTAPTTNQVGAMAPNTILTGLNALEIIEKMAFSYQFPYFNAFTQDKPYTYEVGQTLTGPMVFSWNIDNAANVQDAADSGSLTTSEAGVFSDAGTFNLFNTTSRTLNLAAPYTKNTIGALTVYLNGKNNKAEQMGQVSLALNFVGRIYHLNSTSPTVTALEMAAGNSFLTATRNSTFTIAGSGYKYTWIPDIINQDGITFYDPVNNFLIDMEAPIAMTVTNPQGLALAGKLYRTTNDLGSSLTETIQ